MSTPESPQGFSRAVLVTHLLVLPKGGRPFSFLLFKFYYLYVEEQKDMHVSAGAQGEQRHRMLLELKSQAVVNWLIRALGTKRPPSVRAETDLQASSRLLRPRHGLVT